MSRMNAKLNAAFFSLALATGLIASTATAQAQDEHMTVTVPFSFSAAGKAEPAGKYSVERVSDVTLLLRAADQSRAQFVMVNAETSTQPAGHSKLVFHRIGDQAYLEQIWFAGDNIGGQCHRSRAEKEALQASNVTSQQYPGEEIALNADPQ